jgi:hypothetical protein
MVYGGCARFFQRLIEQNQATSSQILTGAMGGLAYSSNGNDTSHGDSELVRTVKKGTTMLPKYTIEYTAQFRRHPHAQSDHYSTDDPVACEEFVEELLERGFVIRTIKHDGLDLPKHEFDRFVKTAAGMLASKHICASLGIRPEEERFRFGFTA